jgi:Spy/CpxP family protein refolding chaperone
MTNDATNVTANPRPSAGKLRWAWVLALPLAGGLSLYAAQAAQAGPGGGHRGGHGFGDEAGFAMGGGRHFGRLLGSVNATDAQKAQIKAAWDKARPQLETLRGEHRKVREELQKTLAAATIDPAKVETLRRQSVQLMDKTSAVTTQAFLTSAQVLTPEQRQKAAAALEQRHDRGPKPKAE